MALVVPNGSLFWIFVSLHENDALDSADFHVCNWVTAGMDEVERVNKMKRNLPIKKMPDYSGARLSIKWIAGTTERRRNSKTRTFAALPSHLYRCHSQASATDSVFSISHASAQFRQTVAIPHISRFHQFRERASHDDVPRASVSCVLRFAIVVALAICIALALSLARVLGEKNNANFVYGVCNKRIYLS